MNNAQLTQRIERLEKEMAEIQAKMRGKVRTSEDFIGMFRGDPDFKKAMQYGAAYRRSSRPKTPKRRSSK
ncbi:MAG TPA: hypothetical protein VHQ47_08460 [Phycisphaerae bacterium]|jgi:hypothetical protein|nr:hypothetical protein [Phycisphaerae bacterium]